MAGWPGSRQSHTARRIRRRETHSALAGQLLFTFDDAEKGEGAVPKGGGGALPGLVRESWAGALGQEEPSSCACAMRFPRLPAPTTQIRRPPGLSSLGSLSPTNPERSWGKPALRPQPSLLLATAAFPTRSAGAGAALYAFASPLRSGISPSGLSVQAERSFRQRGLLPLCSDLSSNAAYWP